MLTDPMAFVRRQVDNLISQIPGGGAFGSIIKAVPGKMLDLVKEKIEGLFSFGGGGVDGGSSFTGGSGTWRRPGSGRVSSEFGMRRHPITGQMKLHNGIDLAAGMGSPIVAAAGGQVLSAGRAGGYGNFVQIGHAGGTRTGYAHLSAILARAGQIVGPGQLIGREGSTGQSTGPHLHFNVNQGGRWVNPRSTPVKFDTGGWLPPGVSQVVNQTGKPEAIATAEQWSALTSLAARGVGGGGDGVTIGQINGPDPVEVVRLIERKQQKARIRAGVR
jgi:murein DD-endopeptidase MepM/ murein hydrolase activator NlpD